MFENHFVPEHQTSPPPTENKQMFSFFWTGSSPPALTAKAFACSCGSNFQRQQLDFSSAGWEIKYIWDYSSTEEEESITIKPGGATWRQTETPLTEKQVIWCQSHILPLFSNQSSRRSCCCRRSSSSGLTSFIGAPGAAQSDV